MSNQTMQTYFDSKVEQNKRVMTVFTKTLRKVSMDKTMSFETQEDLASMAMSLTAFTMIGAGLEVPAMSELIQMLMKAQMLITMYGDRVCDASDILSLVNELEELLK